MWKQQIAAIIFGALSIFGFRYAPEGLKFANGVYTNVCGSGTTARLHSCSSFCDPSKGTCVNTKGWVAKWTCEGKATGCGENEKSGQEQSLSGTECDRTVTLAVFDKNCRVGGWSCTEDNLKDYMVWYSGECSDQAKQAPQATQALQATITPSLKPTLIPTMTLIPTSTTTPTLTPTPTPLRPSITPRATEGQAPSPTSSPTPTSKPVAQKAPETGFDLVTVSLGLVTAVGVGWIIRRKARWYWPV